MSKDDGATKGINHCQISAHLHNFHVKEEIILVLESIKNELKTKIRYLHSQGTAKTILDLTVSSAREIQGDEEITKKKGGNPKSKLASRARKGTYKTEKKIE